MKMVSCTYLELAMRENAKLATKDTLLIKTAKVLGVPLF